MKRLLAINVFGLFTSMMSFAGTAVISEGRYSSGNCDVTIDNSAYQGGVTALTIKSSELSEPENIGVILNDGQPFYSLCIHSKTIGYTVKIIDKERTTLVPGVYVPGPLVTIADLTCNRLIKE